MLNFEDLFQWERFITPSIIKIFYGLALAIVVLFGLSGIMAGISQFSVSPVQGVITLVSSLLGILIGIVVARVAAEFVLIVFRINEHISAIRNRIEME